MSRLDLAPAIYDTTITSILSNYQYLALFFHTDVKPFINQVIRTTGTRRYSKKKLYFY